MVFEAKKVRKTKKIFGPANSCYLSCQRQGWRSRCVFLKLFTLFHYYPLFSPWLALRLTGPAAPSRPLTELEMSVPFYSVLHLWLPRSTSWPPAGEEPEKGEKQSHPMGLLLSNWCLLQTNLKLRRERERQLRRAVYKGRILIKTPS